MYVLQISCMVILGFLLVLFLTEKKFRKATHKLYIALLVVSILQLVFECLFIWSLAGVAQISELLFKSISRMYFTLVLTYFYLGFRYKSAFVREEAGVRERGLAFIHVVQTILYAGIFILPLGYEMTENGAVYDYGPGMWIVYVGAAFYLFVIFSNYIEQIYRISKEKLFPLVFGIGCGMILCFCYMINPASHITGAAMVIMGIAMFVSISVSDREVKATEKAEPVEEKCRKQDEEMSSAAKVSFIAPNAKVLLVDDTQMNRKIICNLLKKSQIQFDEASGGKECLELLRKKNYHLIFMDHLMPEMDGIETLEIMKKEHLCDGVPVVVMTANAMSMTEEEYLALGFSAYLSKPVLPEKLNHLLYQLLDKGLLSEVQMEGAKSESEKISENAPSEQTKYEKKEEQKENWASMPAVNGLDYDYAALHFKEPSELEDMIHFLVGVMPSDMEQLREYYKNREQEQELSKFCTKVHSMKNSAMTIGIVPLAGLAKTLEDAAREKNEAQMSAMMPVFEDKWEAYRVLLSEKYEAEASDKSVADPYSQEVTALFASLRSAAEEMDIDALDAIMKQIDAYAFPEEYAEKLQQIRRAVTNFDVDYLQEQGYL